jgi:predicted enzyme related to lactoylglutathione lyase
VEYKLDGIVLRCRNVAELSQFYDNVMKLKRFLPPPTEPVGMIARYQCTGGIVFELIGNGPELSVPENRSKVPTTPMFRVDDLGQAVEELTEAEVHWVSERQAIPGAPAELATFLDPEGHHICVFQMLEPDTSRPTAGS